MKNRNLLTASLISAAFLAQPALAQQDKGQMEKQQAAKEQQQSKQEQQSVTGTIVKAKTVEAKGADRKHQVILLNVNNRRLAVDLGDASQFKDVSFKQGQEVTIEGRTAQIGDRQVVVANSIRVGDQNMEISRAFEQSQGAVSFEAQVVQAKTVGIQGQDAKHQLVMAKHGDEQVVIDRGTADKLKDMSLEKGQTLQVTGRAATVGNRQVVVADRVKVGDQTVQIDRAFNLSPRQTERAAEADKSQSKE